MSDRIRLDKWLWQARFIRNRDLADGLVLIIEGGMAAHHIFGSQGPCAAMISASDALIESYRARARA